MMAHSSRDPYWQASVRREVLIRPSARFAIENECSACHMPMSRFTAGHKLPTAYPSRRAWIHFTVRDENNNLISFR